MPDTTTHPTNHDDTADGRIGAAATPGTPGDHVRRNHDTKFDKMMAVGATRYSDALEELRRVGPAVFTQTGGMCAALEVTLERGVLLVTDAEDSLSWSREDQMGWGVGFYRSPDAGEGPEVFVAREETSVAALAAAVEQCLREAARTS